MAVEEQRYAPVRGLIRGLAVLRALNALPGGVGGVSDIAQATGLHRTTVKRLLETLKNEGFVHQKDDTTVYTVSFEVRRLSEGYATTDWVDRIAAPLMHKHVRSLSWPSDLAIPDTGFMIVRESTHRASLLSQHRSTIGVRFPMLATAIGRAWLTWCAEDERRATLALLRSRNDSFGELARDTAYVKRVLRETRKRGYAVNRGEWLAEAGITAVAFPIKVGEHAIAAINLIMQTQMITERELYTRYVPLLKSIAGEISEEVSKIPR